MAQEDHNKGQTDASKGVYNPPNNLTDHLIGTFFKPAWMNDKMDQENKDYDEGQNNHKKQTK